MNERSNRSHLLARPIGLRFLVSARIEYHRKTAESDSGSIDLTEEDQTDDTSQDERRWFDRSRVIVDVHFEGGEATGVASTRDISLGGLYMSTQAEIPVGTTLMVRLPLGSERAVVKADVVYSNPGHGVGVRFHRLPEGTRALMERELPAP